MFDTLIRLTPRHTPTDVVRTITVGYDADHHTFLAQVHDRFMSTGDEAVLIELGGDAHPVTEPSQAIATVRAYAHIPDDLDTTLTDVRDAAYADHDHALHGHLGTARRPITGTDVRFDDLTETDGLNWLLRRTR